MAALSPGAAGFDALNAWMTHYTALWTGSMDRLDDFLQNGDGEDE